MDYLDFELEIGVGVGKEYPITVRRSTAGEARGTLRFPYDDLALENRLQALKIALLQSSAKVRQMPTSEEHAVKDFGQGLFDSLLTGEVRSRFDVSKSEAEQQGKGLRLKLHIQSPQLAMLPWEFMYDPRKADYVSLSNTPVVRYLELPQHIKTLTISPPMHILGMIASPSDLPELDMKSEKQRVEEAIKDLQNRGLVDITWLEGQTWRDLQRAMRNQAWHIFHFIGHGGFDQRSDEGLIALVGDDGKQFPLHAQQLGRLLANHNSLRLVLLNSCEGARGSEHNIFSSTASIIVRQSIPAVLAMQYEVTDRAAIEFARAFYEVLADGYPIDAAVAEARIAVNIAMTHTIEWGTPVLYMRSSDGALFEIQKFRQPPDKINELNIAALRLFDQGKYREAIEKWSEVLVLDPEIITTKDKINNAKKELNKLISNLTADAKRLFEKKEYNDATSKWQEVLNFDSDNLEAIKGIEESKTFLENIKELNISAQQLFDEGKYKNSIDKWNEVLNIDSRNQVALNGIEKTKINARPSGVKNFCPICGNPNEKRLKYCTQCGANISGT